MKNNYLFLGVISIIIAFLNNKNKKNQKGGKIKNIEEFDMQNIYDEPLQKCGNENMQNGSWDYEKKCSEIDGGVHQICINNISSRAKKFSKITGQSDWSDYRRKDNHCVCLGAWSLYVAKKNGNISKDVLKCDAIPKVSLSEKYVSKFGQGWSKWNGLEIDGQVKNGVEGLVINCYKGPKKDVLKKNYCSFANKVSALKNSKLYEKLC